MAGSVGGSGRRFAFDALFACLRRKGAPDLNPNAAEFVPALTSTLAAPDFPTLISSVRQASQDGNDKCPGDLRAPPGLCDDQGSYDELAATAAVAFHQQRLLAAQYSERVAHYTGPTPRAALKATLSTQLDIKICEKCATPCTKISRRKHFCEKCNATYDVRSPGEMKKEAYHKKHTPSHERSKLERLGAAAVQ